MFLFSTINYLRLCESYIKFNLFEKEKEKVSALGKINARADDNRDSFLSGLKKIASCTTQMARKAGGSGCRSCAFDAVTRFSFILEEWRDDLESVGTKALA